MPLARTHHHALSRLIARSELSFTIFRSMMLLIPVLATIAAALTLAVGAMENRFADSLDSAIALAALAAVFFFLRRRWLKADRP